MTCPYCHRQLEPADIARAMSAARKTHAGGRKRKKGVPRCPCGANTLKRAKARNFECCKKSAVK